MIKAIIFDCFGVLTTDGWLPLRNQQFGHNPDLLEQARELNRQVDAGAITYGAFITAIARLSHLSEQTVRTQIESNVPNNALFDLIRLKLKPHYKIGLLSNAADNWLPSLFTSDQIKLIDATAFSYELGLIKPQPEAYQAIAQRLGLAASDCLFVDDQSRYCTGAVTAGMQALHYSDLDQLTSDLTKLGIIT